MTNKSVPYQFNQKKYVPVDPDTLQVEAGNGMTAKEMSDKYGWSTHSVYDHYRKHGHPETPLDRVRQSHLSERQRDIVIGSLLGDGSIRPAGIFVIGHGKKQLDYLTWKVDEMAPFMSDIKWRKSINNRSGKLDEGVYSYSVTHNDFRNLRTLFYPKGKKVFPSLTELSPLALAIWYMDDGTYTVRNGWSYLETQSFTQEENEQCAKLLSTLYGIEARIHKAAIGQFRLGLNKQASSRLFEVITNYVHPTMMYKTKLKEVSNG